MMLRRLVLSAVATHWTLTRCVSASLSSAPLQNPLLDDDQVHEQHEVPLADQPRPWALNFTSSSPHLFASVSSQLHQWSNTIFPNGHTLAAVEVPAYTLLYHGLISPHNHPTPSPASPEWLAFDPEMAYGIMGSTRSSFLLTYQSTRPLRALYFDGESAALMGLGQLDTQMLQLFGNVSGPPPVPGGGGIDDVVRQEYMRAHGLCGWFEDAGLGGRGWGFEGVVRMNAGFEMIWCDFSSPSLRLVSRLNVTAPLLPEDPEEDEDEAVGQEEVVVPDDTGTSAEEVDDPRPSNPSRTHAESSSSYYPLPPQPTKTDRDSEPSHPAAPPNWRPDLRGREPFLRAQGWGWFDSATWHFGATRSGPGQGESRARVLGGCGLVSWYSPRFANQSLSRAADERARLNLTAEGLWDGPGGQQGGGGNRLVALKQLARRRRFHHLGDVGPEEAALMREDSERVLRSLLGPGDINCSGADWVQITSEIVHRTTDHLEMVDVKLVSFPSSEPHNETAVAEWLYDLRAQIHLFMVGYLEYPPTIGRDTWSTGSQLYKETHSRCKYRYTRLLVPEELRAPLSHEEEDIRLAVEDVHGTICSVLLAVGFGVEEAWFESTRGSASGGTPAAAAAAALGSLADRAEQWHRGVEELRAWLGWESQYYACEHMCARDERCYIPMWPLVLWPGGGGGGPGRGGPGGRPGGGRYPHPGHPGRGGGPPPPPPPPDGERGGGPGGRHPPEDGGEAPPPPRDPRWMGDDTDLWEPKCVGIDYIMGQR